MRPSTCPCGSPVKARGLCNACYLRHWYVGTLPDLPERECPVCRLSFVPTYSRAVYCSDTCRMFKRGRDIAKERQTASDHYLTTCREALATDAARVLRDRGFRRVGPQSRRRGGKYFSAWKRSTRDGHHLFVVRWWSPADAREDLEVAA